MSNSSFENQNWADLSCRDFAFFLSLYETRSLTDTAKTFALSMASASRELKKLRDTFEDSLFLRSSPAMIPTSRATELYPRIQELLNQMQSLSQQRAFHPAELERTFRIGVVDNAVFAVMTNVVKALFQEAPRVGLELGQITDNLFDRLANGELDCAVYPNTRELPPGIKSQLLYPISYAVCTKKDHPLARYWDKHHELPLREIRRWRKIEVTNRSQNELEVYRMDEHTVLGESVLQCAISVPFFLAVPSLLLITDFIAFLPMQTAEKMAQTAPLAVMPIHPEPGSIKGHDQFWTRLIWHERVNLDPAMQWLRGLFALYAK